MENPEIDNTVLKMRNRIKGGTYETINYVLLSAQTIGKYDTLMNELRPYINAFGKYIDTKDEVEILHRLLVTRGIHAKRIGKSVVKTNLSNTHGIVKDDAEFDYGGEILESDNVIQIIYSNEYNKNLSTKEMVDLVRFCKFEDFFKYYEVIGYHEKNNVFVVNKTVDFDDFKSNKKEETLNFEKRTKESIKEAYNRNIIELSNIINNNIAMDIENIDTNKLMKYIKRLSELQQEYKGEETLFLEKEKEIEYLINIETKK